MQMCLSTVHCNPSCVVTWCSPLPTKVCAISRDHGAEIYLDKQARKWANELIAEEQQISDKNKAVKGLISVSVAYTKVCTRDLCIYLCVHVWGLVYVHDSALGCRSLMTKCLYSISLPFPLPLCLFFLCTCGCRTLTLVHLRPQLRLLWRLENCRMRFDMQRWPWQWWKQKWTSWGRLGVSRGMGRHGWQQCTADMHTYVDTRYYWALRVYIVYWSLPHGCEVVKAVIVDLHVCS